MMDVGLEAEMGTRLEAEERIQAEAEEDMEVGMIMSSVETFIGQAEQKAGSVAGTHADGGAEVVAKAEMEAVLRQPVLVQLQRDCHRLQRRFGFTFQAQRTDSADSAAVMCRMIFGDFLDWWQQGERGSTDICLYLNVQPQPQHMASALRESEPCAGYLQLTSANNSNGALHTRSLDEADEMAAAERQQEGGGADNCDDDCALGDDDDGNSDGNGNGDGDGESMPTRPPLSSPLLRRSFRRPWFIDGLMLQSVHLWMGHAGQRQDDLHKTTVYHRSQLHHDASHNLYVLLSGRKTISLFPPQDRPFLYAGDAGLGPGREKPAAPLFSRIPSTDALEAELAERLSPSRSPSSLSFPSLLASFPLYPYARRSVVELQAGDMLYLPPGWFHEVKSYGKHAAINFWGYPRIDSTP